MAIIKPGLSVYMVNRAAVKEGCTAGIGSPDCHKALHNLDAPCGPGGSLPCAVAQAFSTGIKHKAVQRHIWPDGREGSVEVIATPLFGYKGDIIGVLETFGTS